MGVGRQVAKGVGWVERRALVPLVLVAVGAVLARGDLGTWSWPAAASVAALAGLLAHRLFLLYRIRSRFSPGKQTEHDVSPAFLELELLGLAALAVLFQLTGGQTSPLYPVLWILLAGVGGLEAKRRNLVVVVSVAAGFELLPVMAPALVGEASWAAIWAASGYRLLAHLAALVFFTTLTRALLAGLALHLRLVAHRDARERRVAASRERQQAELDAHRYRLEGGVAGLKGKERSKEKRQRGSLDKLKQRVHSLLVILHESLRPRTVAFFLLDKDGQTVRQMAHISTPEDADKLVSVPLPAGKGVIGAILKNLHTVSFNHARWDADRFCYYTDRVELKTFLGVPIADRDDKGDLHPRGVLLVDRATDLAFGEDDERLLFAAAQELLHSMDTERVLGSTEKLGGLLSASEQLSRAVNLAEVIDEVLLQVRSIFPMADFTAIALSADERSWLAGVQAEASYGQWKESHVQTDLDAGSLVQQCIEACTVLPATPFHKRSREQRQPFGRSMPLSGLQALKCFPLKVAGTEGRKSQPGEEQAIGALVVAAREPGFFPEDPDALASMTELIETLSNFGAIAIQNAQRFEQLERMATTDGLTGLHNHRRFKEMLDEESKASLRYDRTLSMILTDIDHFKNVNDTYGHPMGDEVLRRVARVLAELARESDRVCRYGGEEFSVILPETDRVGAYQLAERFRESIAAQSFTCDGKQFGITLSLGICTLPEFARHRQELIDRADQALYHAKRNGRDKTVHYADIASQAASGA